MRLRIPVATTLLVAALALAAQSPGSTRANWNHASTENRASLQYGTLGLTVTDIPTALTPRQTFAPTQSFGVAFTPTQVLLTTHPDAAAWTTQYEVDIFAAETMPLYLSAMTDCFQPQSQFRWSTGPNTGTTRTVAANSPYSGILATTIPIPAGETRPLCARFFLTLGERTFYEQYAGREIGVRVTHQLQTAGDASWFGTQDVLMKYVIPIPPPNPPSTYGSTISREPCVNVTIWGPPRIRWRWPDQASPVSTSVPGVNHWGIFVRPNGSTTWTRVTNGGNPVIASNAREWRLDAADELSPFSTVGNYEVRVVAYPFSDETKGNPSQKLWNIYRDGSNLWRCGTTADPNALVTDDPSAAPFGYDAPFPAFPPLF